MVVRALAISIQQSMLWYNYTTVSYLVKLKTLPAKRDGDYLSEHSRNPDSMRFKVYLKAQPLPIIIVEQKRVLNPLILIIGDPSPNLAL